MTSLLQKGVAHLARIVLKHASVRVIYVDGEDSCELDAVVGNTRRDVANQEGVIAEFESRDYIVDPQALRLSTGTVLPRDGALIVERTCDGDRTHVVSAIPGESHWRWSDPHRKLMRIHTRLASTGGA